MSTVQEHRSEPPDPSTPAAPAEPATQPARAPGWLLPVGTGVTGLLVAAATFVVSDADVAAACWTAGFTLVLVALVVAVVGTVHRRGDRLSALPTSRAGWVALACFATGAVLLATPVAVISLGLGLVAGVAGLEAVARQRERSLAVIVLPLLGATFVLAFVLGEVLLGHE
ncbi:hypothetical protein GCM10023258_27340 [Terrabacter aeriphilus]|uniref:Tripartite tricarboxylate transporter TctB family protein n=1 Tax=Terrabacter aeriphilus TaxID=515662 RepID=A0ABP9JG28_9MICO